MGSAECEQYNRFPKARLIIVPREKPPKPEPETAACDDSDSELDAKRPRLRFSLSLSRSPKATRDEPGSSHDMKRPRTSLSSWNPSKATPGESGSAHDTKRRRTSLSLWRLPKASPARSFSLKNLNRRTHLRNFHVGEIRMAMTHRVYFMRHKLRKVVTFTDFGGNKLVGGNSLEIARLPDDSDWETVEKTVVQHEEPGENGGPAVVVPGTLHGPLNGLYPKGRVYLILVAENVLERGSWLNELRLRVTPWSLLREELKKEANSYSRDDLTERMKSLFLSYGGNKERSEWKPKDTGVLKADLPSVPKSVSSDVSDSDLDGSLLRQSTAYISCDVDAKDAVKSNDSLSKQPSLGPIPIERRSVLSGALVSHDLMDKMTDGTVAVDFSPTRAAKAQKWLQQGDMVEKLNTNLTGLVGAGASVAKLADQAQHVADVAGKIGDIAKVVGAASSIFHLVGLGARVVAKIVDEKKGGTVLPQALTRIMYFLRHVLDSAVAVLMTDCTELELDVGELLSNHVFSGLQTMLELMAKIEDQLMRSGFMRFMKSVVLEEIQDAVKELEDNVIVIVHTKLIIEMDGTAFLVGDLPNPPPPSHFFVGRDQELVLLQSRLDEYGSVLITGDEGMGKTQLMIAKAHEFVRGDEDSEDTTGQVTSRSADDVGEQLPSVVAATVSAQREAEVEVGEATQRTVSDRVEDSAQPGPDESAVVPSAETSQAVNEDGMNVPPRIALWVDASGPGTNIVEALANLAEKLIGRKLKNLERLRPEVVVNKLREIFMRREQKWLLCLDEVDSSDEGVEDVLREVCSLAQWVRTSSGGQTVLVRKVFVLITSRRGEMMWNGLTQSQKLVVGRLSEEETQCALWRMIRSICTSEGDMKAVLEVMKHELENENPDAPFALRRHLDAEDSDIDEAEADEDDGDGSESDEHDAEETEQDIEFPFDESGGEEGEGQGDEDAADCDDLDGKMTLVDAYLMVCRELDGNPRKISDAGKVIRDFVSIYEYLGLTDKEIEDLLTKVPSSESSTKSHRLGSSAASTDCPTSER